MNFSWAQKCTSVVISHLDIEHTQRLQNASLDRRRMATDKLTVKILTTVRSEGLKTIIDINRIAERTAAQLQNRVTVLINKRTRNGSLN